MFFFSQIAIDLIAKRILPVLVFCIITYFMIGTNTLSTCQYLAPDFSHEDNISYIHVCWKVHVLFSLVGLQLEAGKFFIYLLTMFMVSLTAASITYAYSSVARVTAVATLLSALTFVLSMVGLDQCLPLSLYPPLLSSCLVGSS